MKPLRSTGVSQTTYVAQKFLYEPTELFSRPNLLFDYFLLLISQANLLISFHIFCLLIGQVSEKRFQEAMDDVIKQNNKVDQDHYTEAVWHFNGEKISEGEYYSSP